MCRGRELALAICILWFLSGCGNNSTPTPTPDPTITTRAIELMDNPQPLPYPFEYVTPSPGAVVPYNETWIVHTIHHRYLRIMSVDIWGRSFAEAAYGSVCVTTQASVLGEFDLYINGQPVASQPRSWGYIRNENVFGQPIQRACMGPCYFPLSLRADENGFPCCWFEALSTGVYIAEVRIQPASGEQEYRYTWAFEITE